MWRPLARRAFLYRRTAPPRKLHLPVNLQVANQSPPLSVESASRFSFFSSAYSFHHNPRFFSSNSAESHDDLPSEPQISESNETAGGFDFSGLNESGEFEKEDSIFDDVAADIPAVNEGFGELFGGSIDAGENLDSVEEDVELATENDGEKVESLLSFLQDSGVVLHSIEPQLEKMKLFLDDDLVQKVLQAPDVPGENLIGFFKWILKKPRFKLTSQVLNELVRSICTRNRRREVYALWDLINEVGEKETGVVSSECLNEIIAEFSKLGKGKAAFEVFNKFEELGCVANADTYYLTIEALVRRSFYDWALSVCEKMLAADMLPDAGRVGEIISYLCQGGMGKDAHLVYLYAKDKKIDLPRSSINVLVNSLCRIEKTTMETYEEIKERDRETVSLALELLKEYSAEDRKYAIRPFSSVIKKLCWIEDFDRATKLLLEMIESGPPPGNAVFNFVITGLTKSENTKEARSLMKVMESRGLRPDVYTYCVIMSSLARAGEMDEACKIFDEAKKKHSKLTPVAYHALIRGFCKLEQFDKAVNLLLEMRQYGVQPKHDEYNKLIKSLCFKALDWETAEKLHEDMNANGIPLNGRTKALISAVRELQEGASTEAGDSA